MFKRESMIKKMEKLVKENEEEKMSENRKTTKK